MFVILIKTDHLFSIPIGNQIASLIDISFKGIQSYLNSDDKPQLFLVTLKREDNTEQEIQKKLGLPVIRC